MNHRAATQHRAIPRLALLLAALPLVAWSSGCDSVNPVVQARKAEAEAKAQAKQAELRQKAEDAKKAAIAANPKPKPVTQDAQAVAYESDTDATSIWDVFYLQGAKIGYSHSTSRVIDPAGENRIKYDSLNHLEVERFGQRSVQDLKLTSLETPDGGLLQFRTEVAFGPAPTIVLGQVDGKQLIIQTTTQGATKTTRIPWSSEIGGFRAMEQSLERRPMAPGEKRTLKMLMPLVNQIAGVELAAGQIESTPVLGLDTPLLRIECVASLPDGNAIRSTVWTDKQGQTIKTRVAGIEQETFRATRELALAPAGKAKADLGLDLLVKLPQPLTGVHQAAEMRYRVELTDANPAKVFRSGPTQSVHALNERTAELTVRSIRPGQAAGDSAPAKDSADPKAAKAEVGPEFTAANNVLQIDDPRIQALAREAQGGETKSPAQTAIALERFVHNILTKKNFSQAFATAAEVADSREGDCTEHAVLLAALARACHIPSRVAIGLVYVEHEAGFGYHMWTEVFVDGQWLPLDATLGQGGIGAGHIKLTDSSLDGASAYSSFLPVAQVAGQLKIRALDAKN